MSDTTFPIPPHRPEEPAGSGPSSSPWRAAAGPVILDAAGEIIAAVRFMGTGGPTDANVALIAAAPAMLAALRVLCDAHEMLFHPKDRIRKANKDADIAMARSAIAKAEGRA